MNESLPQAALAALRQRFRERSLGRLERLTELQRQLERSSAGSESGKEALLSETRRLLHELAGASATFGFPSLGARAAELEAVARQQPEVLAAALKDAVQEMRRGLET